MATGSNLLLDNKRKTHAIDNPQEIFSQLDVVITMVFLISVSKTQLRPIKKERLGALDHFREIMRLYSSVFMNL